MDADADAFLKEWYTRIRALTTTTPAPPLPTATALTTARSSLPPSSSLLTPLGPTATLSHLLTTIAPALSGHNLSAHYYGFVTGATLPVAEAADNLVSALDNSVQVHLPTQSIATEVEDAALRLLLRLLGLGEGEGEGEEWTGRTFTTGATASNVLGLACGREAVVGRRLKGDDGAPTSTGEHGLLAACAAAGIREIQVLTSMGHSSLSKAASVVGLGRRAVKELPLSAAEPWRLDLDAVERALAQGEAQGVASIVAVSAGEVNTGRFAVRGVEEMGRLRGLADRYGAWVHVDGAFGIFARALPETAEFAALRGMAEGLEMADSITVDGHKLLNVPYDTGIFFTRLSSTLHSVFQNPNAAYLSTSSSSIPSPLNIGLENSRRFRALPVYAVLLSEGRAGIAEMLARMVRLARGIAAALVSGLSADYELLPPPPPPPPPTTTTHSTEGEGGALARRDGTDCIHMVVLFRARDAGLNEALVAKIQGSGEWYVSGTRWEGRPACRIAVASWRVRVEEDLEFVTTRLARIAREWKEGGE